MRLDSSQERAELRNLCKLWKEILGDRLAFARVNKENNPECLHRFHTDKKTFEDYSEVLSYIRGSFAKDGEKLVLVSRKNNIIDGICVSSLNPGSNEYYIDGLVTAPWNLKMEGAVSEEHQVLVRKGIGRALMSHLYLVSQANRVSQIVTTPLMSAFTFYKGLGMSFNDESKMFHLPVSETTPEKFRV